MTRLKQSFAWWCVAPKVKDPEGFMQAVKDAGYSGIELLPQELWSIAHRVGLVISSDDVGSLTNGLNRIENHKIIELEVRRKLELAVEHGIPNLIVFSGNRKGLDDVKGAENTIEGLRRLAPFAETSGVTLVLELLNSKVDHVDYQCDHTSWAVDVVTAVNSPYVKILYDIYHMQIMEGDIIRSIQNSINFIGHVHTAGNPGRGDLDGEQEINYPAIMRVLKDANYSGFVGQEFVPTGDPIVALKTAFQLCDV
jgi:hydroxypyruvate isomerase